MFDMQYVAKTISDLRKRSNMTQMELADKLGISFQAVSNWERGQTMPDISKLSELAEIFGVTIDELLGNGKSTKVVEQLIHEEPVEDDLSAEDFLNVAPLVKPRQAEKLFENVRAQLTMKELVMAAPFIASDVLDRMAIEAARREKSFKHLLGLLPFLSKAAIDQCLDCVMDDGELEVKKLVAAAPFLSKDRLDQIAERVVKDGSAKNLLPLAPFLRKKTLTKAAMRFAERDGFAAILPLLPFLDQDELSGLFQRRSADGN
ncbi:MAG: helix-turn-helix domain-containing protein [Firmicutes bacterium]|nr:helix-turn-helix domain-containing protein [Bacillota bacterium]